jgi:hypothetical protein
MAAPAIKGIDLFKIAGRSISGWIPSLKTGITIRQPFCSQLEERLLLWLEYHPLIVNYSGVPKDRATLTLPFLARKEISAMLKPSLRILSGDGK